MEKKREQLLCAFSLWLRLLKKGTRVALVVCLNLLCSCDVQDTFHAHVDGSVATVAVVDGTEAQLSFC